MMKSLVLILLITATLLLDSCGAEQEEINNNDPEVNVPEGILEPTLSDNLTPLIGEWNIAIYKWLKILFTFYLGMEVWKNCFVLI